MNECDSAFYDVTVLLPVTVRVRARDEEDAMAQWGKCRLTVTEAGSGYCVGLPESMSVNEVVDPAWAG